MTTSIATRADKLPVGLCWIAAHGEIPGGLAWKHESGAVSDIAATDWLIPPTSAASFEGVPLTWVPTETAAASTDPRVRAYVKETR